MDGFYREKVSRAEHPTKSKQVLTISTGIEGTNANANAAVAELMRGAPQVDIVAATRFTLNVEVGF
jgi:hypothetical protein